MATHKKSSDSLQWSEKNNRNIPLYGGPQDRARSEDQNIACSLEIFKIFSIPSC